MTPKEKSKELVEKYFNFVDCGENIYSTKVQIYNAKQCALIAVDELINLLPNINLIPPINRKSDDHYFQYWEAVKQELKKL